MFNRGDLMSTARFPSRAPSTPLWQVLYQDAVFEFDDAKLPKRISEARNAIHDKAEASLDASERLLLDNALQTLQVLEEITVRKESA
jgi:hypothetical protein